MSKFFGFILLLLALTNSAAAQILPAEGSVLNYRLVGFRLAGEANGQSFKIEIAKGHYSNVDSFLANKVAVANGSGNRLIHLLPSFGTVYTWRVVQAASSGRKVKTTLRHFNIGQTPMTDTAKYRLKVVSHSADADNFYVFLDANRTMYDKEGRLVWYLPDMDSPVNESVDSRDFKVSTANTITFLLGGKLYEIDYNGKILWHTARIAGDSESVFHHEFSRMKNGHYMALNTVFRNWRFPDDSLNISANGIGVGGAQRLNAPARLNCRLPFGEIVELDEKGRQVWSWNTFDYFDTSDLKYRKRPLSLAQYDVHDNAFFLDEIRGELWVSFKNINRIVKVAYPSGAVIATYGQRYLPGGDVVGERLFCFQHSCKIAPDGSLYLFNNGCDATIPPKVDVYKVGARDGAQLKKTWSLDCKPDGGIKQIAKNTQRVFETMGGNVIPTPDGKIFISYCSPYSKLLYTDKDKNVIWAANPEKWNNDMEKWEPFVQYRASIISKAQLQRLIWTTYGEH